MKQKNVPLLTVFCARIIYS